MLVKDRRQFIWQKQALEKHWTHTGEWQFQRIAVPAIPSDHFATLEIQSSRRYERFPNMLITINLPFSIDSAEGGKK